MVPMRKQRLDHEWLVLIKVNSAIVAQIVQRSSQQRKVPLRVVHDILLVVRLHHLERVCPKQNRLLCSTLKYFLKIE